MGKSSLISTFVSRYFSEVVPGIMTRVRLPPDPELDCVTIICDSQNGDAALVQAMRNTSSWGGVAATSTDSLAALVERAEEQMSSSGNAGTGSTGGAASTPASSPDRHYRQASIGSATGTDTPAAAAATASVTATKTPSAALLETAAANNKPYGMLDDVDSIILVYDLDRVETFFRLEQHWLPLIERCFRGKVRRSEVRCVSIMVIGS